MQNVIQPRPKPDSPISTNSNSGLQRWGKNFIHKPDTQKETKPDPKGNKVTQLMPRFTSQASKKAQSHPTETQIGPTRLPRLARSHPRHPRSRQGAQLKSRWVPPGSRRGSRETPKGTQNEPKTEKRDLIEKTMWNRIILMRKSHFSAQKCQKHQLFCPPAEGHF